MENRYQGAEDVHPTFALNSKSSMPVVFLDIDGVLNSCPKPKSHMLKKYGEYKNETILGYPIWYSPEVIDFINAIHASAVAEVVWLTTWRAEARTEFAPRVGLDDFPAITQSYGSDHNWHSDWWKWRGVRDFLQDNEENRPVVWIDDDLNKNRKHDFYYRYDQERANSLLMTPQSCPGLRPEDLERILDFLKAAANV